MWKCERCGASVPRDCRCGEGDATPPAIPERTEIARLRAQLAEAQQQRDQMREALKRLFDVFDCEADPECGCETCDAVVQAKAALASKETPNGE